MFPRFRPALATALRARAFATRAIYLGSVPADLSEATVREMFGKFGSILKVDLTFSKTGFKFVHVHFSAGDLPANMAMEALHNVNPTDEELKEVETAVSRAVGEFSGTEIGGLNMIVSPARVRQPPVRVQRTNDPSTQARGFKDGFAQGYRQGMIDGQRIARGGKN